MKIFNYISYLVLLIAFGVTLLIIYWLIYPYRLLVFNDPSFPVQTKTVKQGGVLSYTSDYCKYTNNPASVSRVFQDQIIFSVPSQITNRPNGCNVITVGVPVPFELPPGQYILRNVYQYQPNPLRTITIMENTETFTVTN